MLALGQQPTQERRAIAVKSEINGLVRL